MIVIMIFLPGGLVSLGGVFSRARNRSRGLDSARLEEG